MPYVIQPEQELIQMPENEFHARLISLLEQASIGVTENGSTIPPLELDNNPASEYFPHRWCAIRQTSVAKTFEECNEVDECLWFLRKGLERWENLQSYRPNRRKRRRNRNAANLDSDSDSVAGSEEADATSDEESLAVMRRKQAQTVRNMEARVRELIGEFNRYNSGALLRHSRNSNRALMGRCNVVSVTGGSLCETHSHRSKKSLHGFVFYRV
jgi:hypothetical protein